MPWGSGGGVPISHNALQHFPECHEAAGGLPRSGYPPGGLPRSGYPPGGLPGSGTPPGGYPGQVPPRGVPRSGYPPGGAGSGTPLGGVPRSGYPPRGGYPGRTTEGVLTTRRAVCLLRSRRRTFLLSWFFRGWRSFCSRESWFFEYSAGIKQLLSCFIGRNIGFNVTKRLLKLTYS